MPVNRVGSRRAMRGEAGAEGDHTLVENMPVLVDMRVMELLCSRLCHELASPVGAINNGIEMIEEFDQSMLPEALPLIADSARLAAARLKFYRMAYGLAGTRSIESLDEIKSLVEALLLDGRSTLRWPEGVVVAALEDGWGKLLLNLIPLAQEALPRGGLLDIEFGAAGRGLEMAVTACGEGARYQEECLDALAADAAVDDLTPRTVHAYFVAGLAHRLNSRIDVDAGNADRITFSFKPLAVG